MHVYKAYCECLLLESTVSWQPCRHTDISMSPGRRSLYGPFSEGGREGGGGGEGGREGDEGDREGREGEREGGGGRVRKRGERVTMHIHVHLNRPPRQLT